MNGVQLGLRWLVLLGALQMGAAVAVAQDEEDPAAARQTVYRAVDGPQMEDVPGGALLVAAYGAAWVLSLGFMWRVGRLHVQNARELADLRSREASTNEDH